MGKKNNRKTNNRKTNSKIKQPPLKGNNHAFTSTRVSEKASGDHGTPPGLGISSNRFPKKGFNTAPQKHNAKQVRFLSGQSVREATKSASKFYGPW